MNYYKILGISEHSSKKEITKAYRKLALQYHPDRGGDPSKFREITNAYQFLIKPKTEIKNRIKPTIIEYKVSLMQLYSGYDGKCTYIRKELCQECDATGSKTKRRYICEECEGKGLLSIINTIFPGMSQHMRTLCRTCNGTGEMSIPSHDCCNHCNGNKHIQKTNIIQLHIPKGSKDKQLITYKNKGDQLDKYIFRDLSIQLTQLPDKKFNRRGDDLIINHDISFVTALCDSYTYITHLDGRILKIHLPDIISKNCKKTVLSEGMPIVNTGLSGNLHIHLHIKLCERLTKLQNASLQRFFKTYLESDKEFDKEVYLDDYIQNKEKIEEKINENCRVYTQEIIPECHQQ